MRSNVSSFGEYVRPLPAGVRKKMTELRNNLLETLTHSFNDESKNAIERLTAGITPYVRYVHNERERIERTETTLANVRQKLSVLRGRSQAVVGK